MDFVSEFDNPDVAFFNWLNPTSAERTISPSANFLFAVILDTNLTNRTHVRRVNTRFVSRSHYTDDRFCWAHFILPHG